MIRVKRGTSTRKKRHKIFKQTKGFKSSASRLFKVAHQQYLKSLNNSYIGRKLKKRFFRKLWIVRINSTVRQYKTSYSQFIHFLKRQQIGLNRKILSQLTSIDINSFITLMK